MKKYVLVLWTVLLVCVISIAYVIPVSAATTEYNSGINWSDVCEDNNITLSDSYCIARDTDGYYYIIIQNNTSYGGVQNFTCNASNIADVTVLSGLNYYFITGGSQQWTVYKAQTAFNPYGVYTGSPSYGGDFITNLDCILSNSLPILYNDQPVFTATPSTPTQEPSSTETTPTVSGQIQWGTLSGVLIEVTSILPVLLPVLITFIAIRKGLAFILQTLRSA